MRHLIDQIKYLCHEVPLLPITIIAAIPLALIPTWRPWGTWNSSFDPGVGQWIVILLVAWTIIISLRNMWQELKEGHVGVDILAVIALASTVAVQQFWGAWVVMLMVASGDAIESYAQAKAQSSLTALLNAEPRKAHVVRLPGVSAQSPTQPVHNNTDDGFRPVNAGSHDVLSDEEAASNSHNLVTIPVDQVQVGDAIVVKPGETTPVDGDLLSGSATLDLSNINGEPVPRTVFAGAEVLSGSVNGAAPMMIRATRLAKDSQYQHILNLVRSAQQSRAAVVRTADMLAVPFTVISLAIAVIAWISSGTPMRFAQVLVLATPCPLLIAAPVAYIAGTGRLARHGILVKVQDALENLGRVNHIFFDKTGTLTVKQPQVVRIEKSADAPKDLTEDQLLIMAGIVENYSVHILAKGIAKAGKELMQRYSRLAERRAAKGTSLTQRPQYPVVTNVSETTGQGVVGEVDGHTVRVGRLPFVMNTAATARTEGQQAKQAAGQQDGKSPSGGKQSSNTQPRNATDTTSGTEWHTELDADEMATFVSVDGHLAARIVLRDIPRPHAARMIRQLKDMGITNLTMLTGDKEESAHLVADEVGITDVRAQLLPEDKVNAVREASNRCDPKKTPWWDRIASKLLGESQSRPITMMVGDGVNDAPVLAAADIGMAITDGTTATAASESAEVVIMNDQISAVPEAIKIARHTKNTMLQAVVCGITLAIVAMICAAFNLIPVVVGALLQECIDVVSILWALTAMFDRD